MPDMSQAFPGKWMKAHDVQQPIVLTITDIEEGTYSDGQKSWGMGFRETQQRLGLNKTNTQTLIELFATTVEMGGRTVPCVRLRAPSQAQQPQQAGGAQPAFGQQQQPAAQPNDGVPF
jgi:hypothetical protein